MPDRANRRLNSWKEIAEFCGRDVRTVLRWEKVRGLPARRIPGGGRVFAYTAELEQWLHATTPPVPDSDPATDRTGP